MIMPSTNKKSLLLFPNVCVSLIFLFMALPRITMLSRSVEKNYPSFVLKLSRKIIHSFAIRSVKERKSMFFPASFYKVEKVPTYLSVFITINVVFC